MAEAIVAVGAIAASAQLAEQLIGASFAIVELVDSLRDAAESTRKQVLQTEQLIGIAQLIMQNPALQVNSIASVLGTCLQETQELQAILYENKISQQHSDFAKFHRSLKSVLKSKDVNARFERIEREKASLMLCIQEVDSKALVGIGINTSTIRDQVNGVSSVVNDSARDIKTVIDLISPLKSGMQVAESTLPDLVEKVTTVTEEIPNMSSKVSNMEANLLPELLEKLKMRENSQEDVSSHISDIGVPNKNLASFVGREDILTKLDSTFPSEPANNHSDIPIAVIQAMGGQGKTSVAIKYCRSRRGALFDFIIWTNAESKNALESSFATIYDHLKGPQGCLSDISAKIAFVLQKLSLSKSRWLLVFDNYDNPDDFPNIQDFFPQSGPGAILITTRHAGTRNITARPCDIYIKLTGLDKTSASELFLRQSMKTTDEANIEHAKAIVERLGYHALAIVQAGSYIRKRRLDLGDFLEHYQKRKKVILTETPRFIQYTRDLGDSAKETALNVFTTWDLSYGQLESQHNGDLAAKFLSLLAFFGSAYIPEALFRKFYEDDRSTCVDCCPYLIGFTDVNEKWDSEAFNDVCTLLEELCLIQDLTVDFSGDRCISLHPLVKDWIRLRNEVSVCQRNCLASACILGATLDSYLTHLTQAGDYFYMSYVLRDRFNQHILAQEENYREYLATRSSKCAIEVEIILRYVWSLIHFVNHSRLGKNAKDAERISKIAMLESQKVVGNEHGITLHIMGQLTKSYLVQGRFEEAEQLALQVLKLKKRVLGAEHENTLATMLVLASCYSMQGRLEASEKLRFEVIEIKKRMFGAEHPHTLASLSELAESYAKQDRLEEAEQLWHKVAECRRRLLGADNPLTLQSMQELAMNYSRQGRFEEGERLITRVMESKKRVLGPEHPETLLTMLPLAVVYMDQGRLEVSERLLLQVTEMMVRVLGKADRTTLQMMSSHARTLGALGRKDEAITLMEETVSSFIHMSGPNHPATVGCQKILARFRNDRASNRVTDLAP